jgi:hypothetical protein
MRPIRWSPEPEARSPFCHIKANIMRDRATGQTRGFALHLHQALDRFGARRRCVPQYEGFTGLFDARHAPVQRRDQLPDLTPELRNDDVRRSPIWPLLRVMQLICREQPIHVVGEFAQSHSTCIWRALGADW